MYKSKEERFDFALSQTFSCATVCSAFMDAAIPTSLPSAVIAADPSLERLAPATAASKFSRKEETQPAHSPEQKRQPPHPQKSKGCRTPPYFRASIPLSGERSKSLPHPHDSLLSRDTQLRAQYLGDSVSVEDFQNFRFGRCLVGSVDISMEHSVDNVHAHAFSVLIDSGAML